MLGASLCLKVECDIAHGLGDAQLDLLVLFCEKLAGAEIEDDPALLQARAFEADACAAAELRRAAGGFDGGEEGVGGGVGGLLITASEAHGSTTLGIPHRRRREALGAKDGGRAKVCENLGGRVHEAFGAADHPCGWRDAFVQAELL